MPSIEATKQLMNHKDIALVLATGGSGMVKSAYSTGKPALGVGQVMFLLILKKLLISNVLLMISLVLKLLIMV